MALDRLIEAVNRLKNPTVIGLDPKLEYIPQPLIDKAFSEYGNTLEGAAQALLDFNCRLIDALYDIVPAVKPQAAYYEMYGWPGMRALAQTISYAKQKGMFVIIDGKRNDIGSTMEAYAAAHLGKTKVGDNRFAAFGGDALTVNGYLGTDGIKPLLDICKEYDTGIFVLVKTSNRSSGELQDKIVDGKPIYYHMGQMCEQWGSQLPGKYRYSGVGAVVGATWSKQLSELRAALPHTFFLVPGYGAQGANAADIAGAFDKDGMGCVINSSRGIICAWQKQGFAPGDFAQAARQAALDMKDEITAVI